MICRHYLIVYDIADQKRLLKVSKTLKGFGTRMQRSVFEVDLDDASLNRLKKLLLSIMNTAEDGVRIFPVCARCMQGRTGIGAVEPLVSYVPIRLM